VISLTNEYETHKDYMEWVKDDADLRQKEIENTLREVFSNFIEVREVEVILFSDMSALDIANAINNHPAILKTLLASCNIAARAIERDLGIKNLDTYNPKINQDNAKVIAGYLKPFLPSYIELPTLSMIDRIYFIDKEIRKGKGQWEKKIVENLNKNSTIPFNKRMFISGGEQFELDAAYPKKGDIRFGIDIKRIEARRDIHKRCDEIVNKAEKLKSAFPSSKFAAVIYYPFIEEHINIQNRLKSNNIDTIVFASGTLDSIRNASKLLISTLGVGK